MKTEMYYKFILPKFDRLTDNGIITLCNLYTKKQDPVSSTNPVYPVGYVMTYDNLPDRIKNYVDEYLRKPKYFDLRNYIDSNIEVQPEGFSLMVSDSPEVNKDSKHCWTKFNYGGKTIYCSVIVSSGDFYYNFCLPEEVLAISGKRDEVVKSRFHSNWYFTKNERDAYKNVAVVQVGQEKRVFAKNYFNNGFPYGHQTVIPRFSYFTSNSDGTGSVYTDYNNITYKPKNSTQYLPWLDVMLYDGGEFKRNGKVVFRQVFMPKEVTVSKDSNKITHYYNKDKKEVYPERTIYEYDDLQEDEKKDYIDLEVTRRILYKNSTISNVVIPTYETQPNKIYGKTTVVHYDEEGVPTEYKDKKPMPIPYWRLRQSLNRRDPYGDCETLMVMWVVDKDPMKNSLTGLKWEQYAIPISVRCVVKDSNGNENYNEDRFLISYPNKGTWKDDFKFHIRRNSIYNGEFKEALYLQDLIRYSNDYVITFQNTDFKAQAYRKDIFDIQHYLFKNENECSALYVRKQVKSKNEDNNQNQNYYIYVDKNKHSYSVNEDNIIYITGHPTSGGSYRNYIKDENGQVFSPNSIILESDYKKWNIDEGSWDIKNWFIILFNKSQLITEVSGVITLVDASNLQYKLQQSITKDNSPVYNWDNLYLGAFGVLPDHSWSDADTLLYGVGESCVPLGFLDGHIKIGNNEYGRKNHKVVIGFKNMFDYTYSNKEYYHFTYNNGTYTCSNSPTVTAYVMDYS